VFLITSTIWRDSLLPTAKNAQGFKGVLLLGDRQTGKCISITFYETEADAMAVIESGGFDRAFAMFTDMVIGSYSREHFEVLLQA
jgi:hypothetical protein